MTTTIDYSIPMTDLAGRVRKKIDEKVLGVIEGIAPYNYFNRRDDAKALIGKYVDMGHVTPQHAHMLYEAVKIKSLEVGKIMKLGKPIKQEDQTVQPELIVPHYIPPHHQQQGQHQEKEITVEPNERSVTIDFSYGPHLDEKTHKRTLLALLE